MDLYEGAVVQVDQKLYTITRIDDKFVSYRLEGGPFKEMHGLISRKYFEEHMVHGGVVLPPSQEVSRDE